MQYLTFSLTVGTVSVIHAFNAVDVAAAESVVTSVGNGDIDRCQWMVPCHTRLHMSLVVLVLRPRGSTSNSPTSAEFTDWCTWTSSFVSITQWGNLVRVSVQLHCPAIPGSGPWYPTFVAVDIWYTRLLPSDAAADALSDVIVPKTFRMPRSTSCRLRDSVRTVVRLKNRSAPDLEAQSIAHAKQTCDWFILYVANLRQNFSQIFHLEAGWHRFVFCCGVAERGCWQHRALVSRDDDSSSISLSRDPLSHLFGLDLMSRSVRPWRRQAWVKMLMLPNLRTKSHLLTYIHKSHIFSTGKLWSNYRLHGGSLLRLLRPKNRFKKWLMAMTTADSFTWRFP